MGLLILPMPENEWHQPPIEYETVFEHWVELKGKARTFEVYRQSDVMKFIELVGKNDGKTFRVESMSRGRMSDGYRITYQCGEELSMEVLT